VAGRGERLLSLTRTFLRIHIGLNESILMNATDLGVNIDGSTSMSCKLWALTWPPNYITKERLRAVALGKFIETVALISMKFPLYFSMTFTILCLVAS
jgi:hypothetical protein